MNKERIKKHIKEHLAEYTITVAAVAAGITYLVMRERYEALVPDGAYGSKTADTSVTMRSLSFITSQKSVVVNRDGCGRPGYLVFCEELDQWFRSQRDLAKATGVSETVVSKHLSGKIPDANGYHLDRVNFS